MWDVPQQSGEDRKGLEIARLFEIETADRGNCFAAVVSRQDENLKREARKVADAMKPATRARLSFVYFDAGGGHRSATKALVAAAQEYRLPWEIKCLNLQELLDPIDLIKRALGIRVQDVYNYMLEKGWTLGAAQLLPLLHAVIRSRHDLIVGFLNRYWKETSPDLIVSLIPNFNRELAVSIRQSWPDVPFVTVLTDLADYPPHFWIEPESEYLIVGTARAAEQAYAMGHPADRVFLTSGMILNPAFYSVPKIDRRQERDCLRLQPDRLTGLVMFGGQGSRAMVEIARRLNQLDWLQLVLIAGRNKKLEAELRGMNFQIPVHIEGFTTEMPRFMQVSDFFIGKPGPDSLSEALFMGLPVIVERNAWTLPQERFNTDWVAEKELGIVVRSFREIGDAVGRLRDPAVFARYRANIQTLRNRAVYEVIAILEEILARKEGGTRPRGPCG